MSIFQFCADKFLLRNGGGMLKYSADGAVILKLQRLTALEMPKRQS